MTIAIKICGLSEKQTLLETVQAGADFIGFVHYPKSARHVSIATAAHLKSFLPSSVKSVVVLVNPDDNLLSKISHEVQPNFFQLHGAEPPERLLEIHKKFPQIGIIKAISIFDLNDVKNTEKFYKSADYLLFDAKPTSDKMQHGGNGISFNWELLANFSASIPWFLSGGLNCKNVREAIAKTGAKMIDVSSGVECQAGVKDAELIKKFVKIARN
jgi:phosphoribosylanthranilate isomerase